MGLEPGGANLQRMLAKAADGDPEAWRALVQAYAPRVFALVARQCGDRDLAEEIAQDTFVTLVSDLGRQGRYREQGRFEPWLFRVAMNRLRDELRRRRRQAAPMDPGAQAWSDGGRHRTPGGAPDPVSDPAQCASGAEQVQRLRAAIERLSDADRQIVHLRHTAGLTYPQIAEALRQPLGTVLARGHRVLAKLRAMLEEPASSPQR